jgi:transketolase
LNSKELAAKARLSVINMTSHAKAAHTGSSLSVIDILSTLFTQMRVLPIGSEEAIDRVFVSKGHAAAGTYAVMAHAGFFPLEWLDRYCDNDAPLTGHVTKHGVPGVHLSTGSLGHALPFAVGQALASRKKGTSARFAVILSDGECDEGSNWEAALLASHLKLANLTVFIDRNRIQSLGSTETTVALEPLADKWTAFGWNVLQANGHNHAELSEAITRMQGATERPTAVICETVKGFGVSFMENQVLWHYKPPLGFEYEQAIRELKSPNA